MSVSVIAVGEDTLALPAGGGVLVFDGYCGFCTRAVLAVLRFDRRDRVRALPLQGPRVLELTGLTREQALHQAWWISRNERGGDERGGDERGGDERGGDERGGVERIGGAGAMAAAASVVTRVPLLAAYRLPGARQVADRAYRWVAEHRRLLRGVTPWCEAHPEAGCDADVGMSCGTRPAD